MSQSHHPQQQHPQQISISTLLEQPDIPTTITAVLPTAEDFLGQCSTHRLLPHIGPILSISNLPLCTANNMILCATSVIGSRPEQQDRYLMAPSLLNGELSFFAVFDGTTGDYAAEWLRQHAIPVLLDLPEYQILDILLPENKVDKTLIHGILTALIANLFETLDAYLVNWCRRQAQTHPPDEAFKYDYTASTGVISFIHHPSATLCVSHVADSHAVVATPGYDSHEPGNQWLHHHRLNQLSLRTVPQQQQQQQQQQFHPNDLSAFTAAERALLRKPKFDSFDLTKSHKPDEGEELMRITNSGGQLVYLHDNKPFIRGKDFRLKRKAIQLNYSRAFGSKDLKHSGLICTPDILVIPLKKKPAIGRVPRQNGNPDDIFPPGDEIFPVGNETIQQHGAHIDGNIDQQNEFDQLTGGFDSPTTTTTTTTTTATTTGLLNETGRGLKETDNNSNDDDEKDDKRRRNTNLNSTNAQFDELNSLPTEVIKSIDSTDADPYAINSPSVPVSNIGGIGQGRHVATPGLSNINDTTSSQSEDEEGFGNPKGAQVDGDVIKKQLAELKSKSGGINAQIPTTTTTPTTTTPTTTTGTGNNGIIQSQSQPEQSQPLSLDNILNNQVPEPQQQSQPQPQQPPQQQPLPQHERELAEKITRDNLEARRRYMLPPNGQNLQHLSKINEINHNPSIRYASTSDVKALVIGSDGVFDVLTPDEVMHAAFLQLQRTEALNIHALPKLQYVPPHESNRWLQQHTPALIELRGRGHLSVYPDFITIGNWANEPQWNYSPSDAIVAQALIQHEVRRSGDNVTALVIYF